MRRALLVTIRTLPAAAFLGLSMGHAPTVYAQAPAAAQYDTRKVTDNVYIFRWAAYQSMFVVTPDGVIATDPVDAVATKAYIQEIKKITPAPVRYVVYSHHHADHVRGGAAFKEAGATFVAHRQARANLMRLKDPAVVIPDLVVDEHSTLMLGGTRLDLHYVGRNHSDGTLVPFLPKERIIFAADFLPIRELPFRNLFDSYLLEYMESIDRVLALDWDRMIAGHDRQGGIGTKEDVRGLKSYMTELFQLVEKANAEGKCFDKAMTEIKMPKYASWARQEFLPGNIERMCYFFRNGWL
jgi:glyoxylase-like metal-dependent hydrolase (beta-lactamase superfamily II)